MQGLIDAEHVFPGAAVGAISNYNKKLSEMTGSNKASHVGIRVLKANDQIKAESLMQHTGWTQVLRAQKIVSAVNGAYAFKGRNGQ